MPSLTSLNPSAVVHDVFTADSLHYAVIYYLNKYSTYLWCCWPTCIINKTIKKQYEVAERYRSIFGGGSQLTAFSGVHGPNFTKLGEDIGRSSQHSSNTLALYKSYLLNHVLVSEFGYPAAFASKGGSKLSDLRVML